MNASTFARLQRQDELFTELLAGRNPNRLTGRELVRIGRKSESMAASETLTPAQEQALATKWLGGLTFQVC